MAATARGYLVRSLTYKGKTSEVSRITVNPAKALPASTTGNLFTITGVIQLNALVGVVSTATQASNVSPTIGVTGSNALIAAAPASPYNTVPVGNAIIMPTLLGGALPAPVSAQGSANSAERFVVSAAAITITTATTVTGNITWILCWVPLLPGHGTATV